MDINGATGSTYTLIDSDEGKTVKVEVSFTDNGGSDETLTSAATDVVAAAPQPNGPATGAPAITGTARVGETLTADTSDISDPDGVENAVFAYQWIAGGAEIEGATESNYTLTESEQGMTVQVRVSFTDDARNEEALTSAGTGAVAPVLPPLTVSMTVAAPATHDGSAEFTFEIEFSEEPAELQEAEVARLRRDERGSAESAADRQVQQYLLADNGAARLQRRCVPSAAGHHGLRRSRSHLHPGHPETVQLPELHRLRPEPIEQGDSGSSLPARYAGKKKLGPALPPPWRSRENGILADTPNIGGHMGGFLQWREWKSLQAGEPEAPGA